MCWDSALVHARRFDRACALWWCASIWDRSTAAHARRFDRSCALWWCASIWHRSTAAQRTSRTSFVQWSASAAAQRVRGESPSRPERTASAEFLRRGSRLKIQIRRQGGDCRAHEVPCQWTCFCMNKGHEELLHRANIPNIRNGFSPSFGRRVSGDADQYRRGLQRRA